MPSPWDSWSPPQRAALERLLSGPDRDLTRSEAALFLRLEPRQVWSLAQVADLLRAEQCGDEVTYVINRNINFTNVCIKSCKFCAFSREHRDEQGYELPVEEILRRVEEAVSYGATEVCVQAGLPPKMEGDLYVRLTRTIKARHPDLHLHAFSPEEVLYGAVRSRCSVREYLQDLKAAGLDSLPGTSAEILEQGLRDRISPGRITVQQWFEVVGAAHQCGLPTTSTMMFGHLEEPEHWLTHMLSLRQLQLETGGFTEFVPLGFIAKEAPLSRLPEFADASLGPSGSMVLHVHALARLLLGRTFRNIQASWVKEGEKLAGLLLAAGCNDLGGTLMNESISTAAGAAHGQLMSPKQLEHLIREAGRTPRQRNTLYQVLEKGQRGSPLDEIDDGDGRFGSYRALATGVQYRFVHPARRGQG